MADSDVTENMTSDITTRPNGPIPFSTLSTPFCQWILFATVGDSEVRVWDLIILIPNILFLLFLLWKSKSAVAKLRTSDSPIFSTFYILVCGVCLISNVRCLVSMTVDATTEAGDVVDKVLWLLLRFFLLATELSVVVFGLAFGHLDSRTSIRRVLMVTFSFSLVYSGIQGALEFVNDHPHFKVKPDEHINSTASNFNLFAHGGMVFLFVSSLVDFLVYTTIIILPFTALRERFQLPTKRLFYYYCLLVAVLNLAQCISSLLMYYNEQQHCMCVIDVTTLFYFTLFNPLLYAVFLYKFFRSRSTGLQFSYKQHDSFAEEDDDDQLSLPHSNSGSTNVKPEDVAPIFSYDSTNFNIHVTESSQHPTTSVSTMPANSSSGRYSTIT